MKINADMAIVAGAYGLGALGASWALSHSSTSNGVGRYAVPTGLGVLGGGAAVVSLLRTGSQAGLGTIPLLGGAVAAGAILGGVLGAITHRSGGTSSSGSSNGPTTTSGSTWDPGTHGSYDNNGNSESWDGQDPTGKPHPTPRDVRPGDILPNVVPQRPSAVGISTNGNSRFFDFATTTGNLGQGPLELVRHYTDPTLPIMQVVHNRNGSTHEVPTDRNSFEDGPKTNHLAFDDFAKYELFAADANGHAGKSVAKSHYKESFLIIDTNLVDPSIDPHQNRRIDRSQGDVEVQGISPGWGDTYGPGLCGQSFDITNLPDGRYVLRQTMDPGNRFIESSDADNVRDTVVDIRGTEVSIVSSKLVSA